MSKVVKNQADRYSLSGSVDLGTAMSFRDEIETTIPAQGAIQVDLQQLEAGDSAALPLLVFMVRRAKHEGGQVTFLNVPKRIQGMADLAGLDHLLFLEG